MSVRAHLHGIAVTSVMTLACMWSAACTPQVPLTEREYPPPRVTPRGTEIGRCSWYGPGFHGLRTANGEVFDQSAMTAAHRTLPLGTNIEVVDLATGRSVVVRVNDRGPYHPERVLDLSRAAAEHLGILGRGLANVEIRVLEPRYSRYPSVHYSVQLGAFRNRAEAERVAARAADRGARVYVERSPSAPSVYQVRLGPFENRARAADVAQALRDYGFRPVIIENLPPIDQPA